MCSSLFTALGVSGCCCRDNMFDSIHPGSKHQRYSVEYRPAPPRDTQRFTGSSRVVFIAFTSRDVNVECVRAVLRVFLKRTAFAGSQDPGFGMMDIFVLGMRPFPEYSAIFY